MRIVIENNYFDSNCAVLQGGAIMWANYKPIINNNEFNNNSAEYGSDIAAYPIRLAVDIYNKSQFSSKLINESNIILKNYQNKTLLLQNISSGNDVPFVIVVKVFDVYNHIVALNSGYNNLYPKI